jgi:translocator protein
MKQGVNIPSFLKLIIAILVCEGVGITSGLLSQSGMGTWFDTLNKPSWNPPSYLFGPVWTFLYLLMGISLWLIWKRATPESPKTGAILLFSLQLFFNFWWSILFFKFHFLALSLADIVLMVITILLTIFTFASTSRAAAWLLVPYILWVSFATFLNYTIWLMN